MQIYYERTGGFAGMRLAVTLDSEKLPDEEARKLQQLVEAAHFFTLPAATTRPLTGADRFQYKLTVQTQQQQHTVEVVEAAIPMSMRPLLEWLTGYARNKDTRIQ